MEKDLSKNYKEINIILDILGDSYKNKVPKKMRKLFELREDKTYSPKITENDFLQGNYLKDTKVILSILNINYWSTPEKKNEYMNTLRALDAKYMEEHKLVLNEIFPERKYEPVEKNGQATQIATQKNTGIAGIISNILDKIKGLFGK